MDEHFSLAQVATWLGCDLSTLYRWRQKAGLLKETADGMTRAQVVRLATNHHRELPASFFPEPTAPASPLATPETATAPLSDLLASFPWEDDTKARLAAAEREIRELAERLRQLEEEKKERWVMRPMLTTTEDAPKTWTAQELRDTLPASYRGRKVVKIPKDLPEDSLPAALFGVLHHLDATIWELVGNQAISHRDPLGGAGGNQFYLTPEVQRTVVNKAKQRGLSIKQCPRPRCPCNAG